MGYEICEYSCIPIGKFEDSIDIYRAINGMAEIRKKEEKSNRIPVELR